MKPKASFKQRVILTVRGIPKGRALSYAEVAALAGSSKAARAVGNIMKANKDPKVPCHRVIKSDGSVGEYNRGKNVKTRRLRAEGVQVRK